MGNYYQILECLRCLGHTMHIGIFLIPSESLLTGQSQFFFSVYFCYVIFLQSH